MFPDLEFIKTALNAITDKFRHVKTDVDAVQANVDAVKSDVDAIQANVDAVKNNAPDWNEPNSASHAYIKNKPCYDYVEPSGVIWESDSAGESGRNALELVDLTDGRLIEGETYRLTVDGVETTYTCTADADGLGLYIGASYATYDGGIFQSYKNTKLYAYTSNLWEYGQKVRLEGPLRRYKKLNTSLYDAVVSVNGETGEVEITPENIEAAKVGSVHVTTNSGAVLLPAIHGIISGEICGSLYLGGDRWFEKGTTSDTGEECFLFSPLNTILAGIKTPTQDAHAANKGYVDAAVAAVGERLSNLSEEMLTEESDPTVPAWAKAAQKPSYTASEVGAIAQTELQAAVDTALAQAKASGAFDGAPGADGQDGTTPTVGDNGNWFIGDTDTGKPSRGEIGPAGADGTTGADGKSAYQFAVEGGYTGTKAEFAAKLAQEKFANPNALTFVGAVTGSYDGSAPLEVEIPSGGGAAGDYIPVPATAEVGQTIVVKAVDEDGKPTEWEAADMASGEDGWTEIGEITLDGTEFIISDYSDGVVTIAPENGVYPQVNKNTVLRKSDYSSYINVRFVATGTDGQYTMKNLDGAVYAPSDDLTQYVVDVPSADSLSFSNIPAFSFFKAKITTPLLCVHGVRSSFVNSYGPFNIVSGDCTGLSGGAAELVLETEDSPIAGKIYSKGSFKGKSASRQNGYDVIQMFDRPTAPANITFIHYNGLLTIGTKVKLWGRN